MLPPGKTFLRTLYFTAHYGTFKVRTLSYFQLLPPASNYFYTLTYFCTWTPLFPPCLRKTFLIGIWNDLGNVGISVNWKFKKYQKYPSKRSLTVFSNLRLSWKKLCAWNKYSVSISSFNSNPLWFSYDFHIFNSYSSFHVNTDHYWTRKPWNTYWDCEAWKICIGSKCQKCIK